MPVFNVFGTGLHRTGTTSLHHALEQLGFRSIHAPFALFETVHHDVITRHDAFTDLPVPLLYRKLDEAFPGSKFVHTVRDAEAWIESVRWLFTEGRRRFHWDTQPVVAEIHEALYGTTVFDERVFRQRYRRHNEEVVRHFEDRPDQLLVMDITGGEGWNTLCPFLGVQVPEHPFPARKADGPQPAPASRPGGLWRWMHAVIGSSSQE